MSSEATTDGTISEVAGTEEHDEVEQPVSFLAGLADPVFAASPSERAADGATAAEPRGLIERHRAGDPRAFSLLVEQYRCPVYSYLGRCGVDGKDRDDLFQEIFLKIHRGAASYESGRPLHPWVFTIVANTVRNHFRKLRVRELVSSFSARLGGGSPEEVGSTEVVDPAPDGARVAEAKELLGWLEREIQRLPLGQRQVLLLRCVEALSLEEVASALGLPLNTVKTRLHRARSVLIRARALWHEESETA